MGAVARSLQGADLIGDANEHDRQCNHPLIPRVP